MSKRKIIVSSTSKLILTDGSIRKINVDKTAKEAIVTRSELSITNDKYAPPLICM